MDESTSELSFDRAAFTENDAGEKCTSCGAPVGETYFTWQQRMVCAACKDKVHAIAAKAKSGSAFWRAALLGGGAAVGCGILYAIFVQITNFQLALATIGIAFVIAKVVRKASAGVGARRFQVLAVALTYLAACMGYAPGLIKGVQKGIADQRAQATVSAAAHPPVDGSPASAAPNSASQTEATGNVGVAVLKFFGTMLGILLVAPFLEFGEAPLGLLIIAFGLWEAWKLSRGIPLVVDGPFRVRTAGSIG
jgi:hypothetical protein